MINTDEGLSPFYNLIFSEVKPGSRAKGGVGIIVTDEIKNNKIGGLKFENNSNLYI